MALRLDAHIPAALRDPVLIMGSESPHVGNSPTIFVGIVDDNYTDEMWSTHKERLCLLFGITDPGCMCDIKIGSIGAQVVDAQRLGKEITKAMHVINSIGTETLRIVGLGIASASVVTEALESLIRGWEIASDAKKVQFVALGESPNYHYLNFCKGLCMKKMCKTLQYYNTMDYNDFGFIRSNIGHSDDMQSNMALLKMLEQMERMKQMQQ